MVSIPVFQTGCEGSSPFIRSKPIVSVDKKWDLLLSCLAPNWISLSQDENKPVLMYGDKAGLYGDVV